ncbi:hypothetical protein A0O28_0092920 [Trichoderma guizhouense]|uniref:Ankyrin repeat protein n=1 Tax=Trichoderma guizhouense TaxID=1491466 RepID=A0A1T3CXD8_9HYPO|nr:hypothetical protein A0O28_0092920 [Trichoderma guizhouense]
MPETASSNILETSMDYSAIPKSKDLKMESFKKEMNEKLEKSKGHRHNLNILADTLYAEIHSRILHDPDQGQREIPSETENQIRNYLKNANDKNIDDCILWLILISAVEKFVPASSENTTPTQKDSSDMDNPNFRIIRIILDIVPHLSFESLQPANEIRGWGEESVMKRCKANHSYGRNKKTTPFHAAVEDERTQIVAHMLNRGDSLLSTTGGGWDLQDFIKILQRPKPDRLSSLSTLSLAAINNNRLETVEMLLRYNPDIAISPTDSTFENSLKEGKDGIVDAFFEYKELQKEFITAKNVLLALEHLSENTPKQGDPPESYMKVVCALISHAPTKEELNDEVVKEIIQLNLRRVWESRDKNIELEISEFLHIAVQCQNAEFVKMFMDEYPESVLQQIDNRYALWHNNFSAPEQPRSMEDLQSEANRNIREMLVTKIIKGNPDLGMQQLLEIFRDSEVEELCFDLSRFNSKKYLVSDFVRSLISHQDNPDLLSYEHTLKYAEFPNLDAKDDEKEIFGDDVHYEHAEVFLILDWLRNDKKVREIIELTVPDRLVNPHNEVKIPNYVKFFQVQILNWRFLDLSITVLPDQETKERIKELHLYASGKRAAISHWTSENGILTLPNVSAELIIQF